MLPPSNTVEIGTLPIGTRVKVFFAGRSIASIIDDHIPLVQATIVRMDDKAVGVGYYCSFAFSTQVERIDDNV